MDTQQSVDAAVVPEDDDNLLDWLGNVKAIVSEQDVQMWAEKAFVQEIKAQTESLEQTLNDLKSKTAFEVEGNNEREVELCAIEKSKESLINSIDLTRKSLLALTKQLDFYNKERASWNKQYEVALKEHNENYDSLQDMLTADSEMYRNLNKLKINEMKIMVDIKYKQQSIQQEKAIKKNRSEIKKLIYNADIIDFAKACLHRKELEEMCKQIKELEQTQNSLRMKYAELQRLKAKRELEQISSCVNIFNENEGLKVSPLVDSSPQTRRSSYVDPFASLFDYHKFSNLFESHYQMPATIVDISTENPRKKLKRNPSKIKILDVQTLISPQSKITTPNTNQNVVETTADLKQPIQDSAKHDNFVNNMENVSTNSLVVDVPKINKKNTDKKERDGVNVQNENVGKPTLPNTSRKLCSQKPKENYPVFNFDYEMITQTQAYGKQNSDISRGANPFNIKGDIDFNMEGMPENTTSEFVFSPAAPDTDINAPIFNIDNSGDQTDGASIFSFGNHDFNLF